MDFMVCLVFSMVLLRGSQMPHSKPQSEASGLHLTRMFSKGIRDNAEMMHCQRDFQRESGTMGSRTDPYRIDPHRLGLLENRSF